jgi:hypothetical protein
MFVRLPVASSPRPQVLFGKWVAAWRAVSSQVEGASTETETEAEAEAETQAWKSIDQLS